MPSITLIFAAAAALVNLWLGMRIGRLRTTLKISHGDGGNPMIARRMRAQLNFAESAPVVLILFLALELSGANPTFLWVCAVLFIVTWAYARAEAQVLIPVEYTAFIWAAICGWVFFGEALTWPVLAGTALIVAGCLISAHASTRKAPPPVA